MTTRGSSLRFGVYVFFSGACALLYQTVWQRDLRLIFGGSTAASGAVLAAFIGGLGLGSLLLARRVEASTRPFALYAVFELIIAASTALTPALFTLVRGAYVGLGGTEALGSVAGTGLRVVLTFLVIFIPTFFMGGTLPAVARAVTTEDDAQRGGVAMLYGLNTLGAVCGAGFATFSLLPSLGNHRTLWAGCAINLLVALAALFRARTLAEVPLSPAPGLPTAKESAPAPAPELPPTPGAATAKAAAPAAEDPELPRALVLGASFIAGAVFFLMELVWFRMLAPILGGTVFTFGLVLCVALAGIGLGGAAYGALARRGAANLSAFALTCLLEALAVAVPLGLGDRLALLAITLRPFVALGLGSAAATWAFLSALVVFPAAFVAGVQFPLLIALAGRARTRVAAHVAQVYAANTSGSVLGALAGGFGALPLLTAPGAWRLAAASLLVLGLVAASLSRQSRRWPRLVPLGAIAALTVFCLLALGPTPVWRHSAIGQGRTSAEVLSSARDAEAFLRSQRGAYLWERDGVEAAVGLYSANSMAFIVNGKSDGSSIDDAATQVMSGLLGALLHPAPRRVLVIGLGTGSTAGWLGLVPEIERVDVMEFEPVILEVARTMSEVNGRVLDNPKVHIQLGDARELLALSREKYDVIFSEPSNPYRVGIANLFTQEYYRQVQAHLKPGGIFLQWMQAYEVDAQTIGTVYSTLRSVFASVETWTGAPSDLLLIGTEGRLRHDLAQIAQRIAEEPYRSALNDTWFTQSKEGVFAHYLAGPELSDFLVEKVKAPINTDDFNRIEFGFARTLGQGTELSLELNALTERFHRTVPRYPDGLDLDLLRFERWLASANHRSLPLPPPPPGWSEVEYAAASAMDALILGDVRRVTQVWPQEAPVRTPWEALVRLGALAGKNAPGFRAEADALRARFPFEVPAIEALEAERRFGFTEAVAHWEKAFLAMRTTPWFQTQMFWHAMEYLPRVPTDQAGLRRLADALSEPFSARVGDQLRRRAFLRLLARLGDHERCAQVYEALLPHIEFTPEHLTRAVECFRKSRPKLAPAAEADLARFVSLQPLTLELAGARLPPLEVEAPPDGPGADGGVSSGWSVTPDAGVPYSPMSR